ncbi:maleylacetoacetate isomerase [Hoeflea prorocentri]|uniref:Maleylacetoacetate isomerase n=1 Tax=Hoeflea prorocentri TaxID=1922333 RepID=A0A9X3UMJ5_9HYPH|nr:maleylacetoacetate isomerase [Hoeflea prorocentri]MCY6383605.1 maleylacetoacetate isomerase [Hoeflea prorocentri]MDA5401405.1 maleylacetoacetate isomerase [Hoeflea prorocentri]
MTPVLYDYWRSSASYRVRIALNLAEIEYDTTSVDLLKGEHLENAHLSRNPQGFVPALDIDGQTLTQSLAIIEYLNETRPVTFLPDAALERSRVRTLSYIIAMEIHPICNSSVAADIMARTGGDEAVRVDWMKTYIRKGLAAFEKRLGDGQGGTFCHGDAPTMADICLVPQLYNAERWGADIADLSRIKEIAENCARLEAFAAAHPDRVNAAG